MMIVLMLMIMHDDDDDDGDFDYNGDGVDNTVVFISHSLIIIFVRNACCQNSDHSRW